MKLTSNLNKFALAPIAAVLVLFGASAKAEPVLQLGIAGGTYDAATQTIMASGNSFSLYAYGLATGNNAASTSTNYYLSMALMAPATSPGSFGSFTMSVNGGAPTTIGATSGMTYGTAPLETTASLQGHDAGDLALHGIFPTYFAERGFQFSASQQSARFNTQDHPGWGPQSGTGMYYVRFDFDISGLDAGRGLHFDLYNETISSCGKKGTCTGVDIDVKNFAPFSHDAQAMVTTPIPEPETYAMLLAGLGLMGFVARRRRQGKEL
jgi:PEP-CTERM motif